MKPVYSELSMKNKKKIAADLLARDVRADGSRDKQWRGQPAKTGGKKPLRGLRDNGQENQKSNHKTFLTLGACSVAIQKEVFVDRT